ncbi:hypothetical protein [Caballeronia sordidicola]|uniref:hypothetical protein n=1 Tax=Caballeronia sordidicola TaxID=196367 RepID=UPI000764AD48|nr:hypothetical protein [Caballeronia sordidicola]
MSLLLSGGFDPLAGELAPTDVAGGAAAALAPLGAAADADEAPATLPPTPDELLRPVTADESEFPPPPPHALTLRIAPPTKEITHIFLRFIIIYTMRKR